MLVDNKKIERIRKLKDKNQKECGNAIGVGQPSYNRKEKGKEQWSPDQLKNLADFLECKIDEFYNDVIAKKSEPDHYPEQMKTLFAIIDDLREENKKLKAELAELKHWNGTERRKGKSPPEV